jgi:hypothetical protein
MSKRTASLLAWSMCALSLALAALSLLLLTLNLSHPEGYIFDYWLQNTVIAAAFSTVGAVVTSRRPNNIIGWLSCAIGLTLGLNHFVAEYAIYALLAQSGSLPGGEVAAWLAYWIWVPALTLIVFFFLLFPTGRLPSSRWRWFAGFSAVAALVGAVLMALSSENRALGHIPNPLGIESVGTGELIVQPLIFTLALLAAISMFMRLRRASEVERQQIKWFAYAAAVAFSGGIIQNNLFAATNVWWVGWGGFLLSMVGLFGMPIAMGIAILRYRLYEIDLIINRTLVYGALTATLVLFYFGSVTALQYLFSLLTGQGNTLAIVASTLAIAALFNPLRRRIQSFIDRRFYRRKYDARKILEAFGSRLRDETDLERISDDLLGVVSETMQPSHVSVILRSEVPSTTSKEQGQQDDQQTTSHED